MVPPASASRVQAPPDRRGTSLIAAALFLAAGLGIPSARCDAPAADPIAGIWTGTVTAPQGTVADFGLDFYRVKDGRLTFRMNFPAMFTYNAPFGMPVAEEGNGRYSITPDLDIDLQLEGDRLTGTFGAGRMPVELRRGGRFAPRPPAETYAAGPAALWRFDMGGGTWASPVVADGTIYIGTSAGLFHAVRAGDGTAEWTWKGASGIDGRAVVGRGTVYVVDTRTNLVALDRKSGSLRWISPLHDERITGAKPPANPTFNHRAATPLLLGSVIYCGSSDGGLYAVDAETGATLWRHEARAAVFSGVGLLGSDTLMFGTMDGSVVLLNCNTQRETLRVRTGGPVVTTPILAAGILVAGSRDYMLHGFNLADGTPAWRFSYWFSWVESTPALVDGLIYVGGSDFARVTALDPATGRARWSTPVRGITWGTPLVTADTVFAATASQNMAGTVVAHAGGIMALDRATGTPRWLRPAAPAPADGFGGYAGSLAIAGDKVIAAGFDGGLIALPAR